MKRESRTLRGIRRMCERFAIDGDVALHNTKLLLNLYRDVVWAATEEADLLREESGELMGGDLEAALTYLSALARGEERRRFEERVTGLFETRWMIGLVDTAMGRIYDYHRYGRLYHEILSKSYLTVAHYSESELLETLGMERSTFYDRKKEAVMLLGVAIWGYALPRLRGVVGEREEEDDFFPT